MTLEDKLDALDSRVSRLEHKGKPKADWLRLLLPMEYWRWQKRLEQARTADPEGEGVDIEYEAGLLKANQHFLAVPAIETDHEETQIAVIIMYQEGVFGPVYDSEGEEAPSPEEAAAIARAGLVAAGLPPE